MPHLLTAITAHGYGHLAQTAPVLNALRRRLPALRLTLYSALPRALLEKRIEGEFAHIERAADVGMVMRNALSVDTAASAAAYLNYHRNWTRDVAAEAAWLKELAPDAIFANVPYRILAAAEHASIPAVALCSLNWTDLYQHLCGECPEAAAVLEQMRAAYNAADIFLQPAPSMPMPDLKRRRAIGPIARLGQSRRPELAVRCGAALRDRLVLVSLGGIPTHMDVTLWPQRPGIHWIVPQSWHTARRDMSAFESLGLDFVDTLCSVDVLLTKPGYGSFTEAVCNGIPVLYLPREEWPEAACLVEWLHQQGRGQALSPDDLLGAEFSRRMTDLLQQPAATPPLPSGINAAATVLDEILSRGYTGPG